MLMPQQSTLNARSVLIAAVLAMSAAAACTRQPQDGPAATEVPASTQAPGPGAKYRDVLLGHSPEELKQYFTNYRNQTIYQGPADLKGIPPEEIIEDIKQREKTIY